MSDKVKLIVEIPKEHYDDMKASNCWWSGLKKCVMNGIPLPKGHGRLIDADALNARMEQRMNEIGDDESIWESSNVATALDIFAPTIIEADTESEVKPNETDN